MPAAQRPRGKGPSLAGITLLVALMALGALAIGVFGFATMRPQTSDLRREVAALQLELRGSEQRLATVQTRLDRVATQRQLANFGGTVGALRSTTGALRRGVAQLQSSIDQLQSHTAMLLFCVPELQQEISGLGVRSTNINGWLRSATLSGAGSLSQSCAHGLLGF